MDRNQGENINKLCKIKKTIDVKLKWKKSIRMEKKDLSFTKLHRVSKQAAHLKSMKSLFKHPVLIFPYVAELVQRPTPEYGGHLVNQKESHSDIGRGLDGLAARGASWGWSSVQRRVSQRDNLPDAILRGKDSSAKGGNSAQDVIPSNGDPDNASSRGRGVPPIEI